MAIPGSRHPSLAQRAEARARLLLPELQQRGLRQLAITFVNHGGLPLVKGIPLARLPQVAASGVGFSPVSDGFGATGGIDGLQSLARPDGDLRLIPDLDSLVLLDVASGWGWLAGDRFAQDGSPYAADQRSFCRLQGDAAAMAGLTVNAGFEIEWVVGSPSGVGGYLSPTIGGSPYGADRLIEGLDYLSAITAALDAAGLPWLQIHPEYGASQFELSLAAADPLQAADQLVCARLIIQRVSLRFGWRASFSPMVSSERVGNGGHVHLSLERDGVPLFGGGNGPGGLTTPGQGALAALLERLPALLAIATPLAVSYRRLVPGRWAAPFQIWGVENREAALRLIPGGPEESSHLELKVVDAAANPYLLLGALMAVMVHGIDHPSPLPPPVVGDPARLGLTDTGENPAAPARLPRQLSEAVEHLRRDDLLAGVMGEALHHTVIESREAELRRSANLSEADLIATTCWWPPIQA
ncbi:glutamine synthetase [Synechococcus sp. CBW1002]|uniref:glutamine synthetase family protein n=1 Tax=Synechococcus sp. CBW1002 TaxID=1353134 RepID=UPI0018CD9F59|nr:glutamine synthetase family protein [Synechococcus sp. CBW1002]QPN60946.1 glutamine synthetase [Synechococcus sp. CBW1002]